MIRRRIDLREYERSEPLTLSLDERAALRDKRLSLAIEPADGVDGAYHLRAGSKVGAVDIGGLSLFVQPKISIPKLLSLACYAIGAVGIEPEDFDFAGGSELPDVLALALASHARRAFARGLLHGYRAEEDALRTVRGRIRFDEQLRRRFGAPLPVEVSYDEFTDDILANRLVKAATARLGRMRLRSQDARRALGRIAGILDNVSLVEFPRGEAPTIRFDRLNEHYRGVLGLSRLIMRHSEFESSRGDVRASGFLMDMNVVFQEFVTQALREALGVSGRALRSDKDMPRGITLDRAGRLGLRPDISWWVGGVCRFVGDVKYKRIVNERVPNADLYQMLAYATALDLPGGLLIYAEDESDLDVASMLHEVRHSGKRLEIVALDLSGSLEEILARVYSLARKIAKLRAAARAA